jgi:hypothetical protein
MSITTATRPADATAYYSTVTPSAQARGSNVITVEVSNSIGPGVPDNVAAISLRVNGEFKGTWHEPYHSGVRWPVRLDDQVTVRVEWHGQIRKMSFIAQRKPEGIKVDLIQKKIVLLRNGTPVA